MSTPKTPITDPPSTLRAYARLVRLPNLFTAMADVMMGFLVTHAAFGPKGGWIFVALLGASTILYAAGVVLNDVFDYEVDCRERPERPLPSGRISLGAARWLGWELLVIGLASAWLAASLANDVRPGLVATLLAGCIVAYNALLKPTVLGPPAMGACRMLNVLLGMSVVAGSWQDEHWLIAAAIGTYIVGVTWFSRREAGQSRRWQLGLATAVMLSGIGLLTFLPGMIERVSAPFQQQPGRWTLLVAFLAVLIGFRCLRAVVEPSRLRVQTAVKVGILSLVVLDAAACLLIRGMAGASAVLLLLVPTVVLGRWIEST